MPKVSKVGKSSRQLKPSAPEERCDFYCSVCGKHHTKQKGNYPASQSPLYKGNGGYMTACRNCVEKLFEHYKELLGSEPAAIRRICLKFDIYWHSEIYAMLSKTNTAGSRVFSYISKTNLYKYVGKSYDDTVAEEEFSAPTNIIEQAEDSGIDLDPAVVEFWGAGFEPAFYLELDRKYKQWTENLEKIPDTGEAAIYKQVCILEATINREAAAGKSIEKNVNALNSLLGSLNVKPIQKKEVEDVSFDKNSFGVGIRMFENSYPIPEPDPDFQDFDGIVKYITTWFLGHLCKMLGIKNTYCKLYEQELEKMRIERPDLEEVDDESLFNDIFGGDS